MNRTPDVEVIFKFNGTRTNPAVDGYRPAHLITDSYLTTGVHHYYKMNAVPPNGTATGTITLAAGGYGSRSDVFRFADRRRIPAADFNCTLPVQYSGSCAGVWH